MDFPSGFASNIGFASNTVSKEHMDETNANFRGRRVRGGVLRGGNLFSDALGGRAQDG